jgi:hypothetical protein
MLYINGLLVQVITSVERQALSRTVWLERKPFVFRSIYPRSRGKQAKMIVQALVVDKPGDPFVYQDIQLEDAIRDDEVLVGIKATGVCHTDLNFSKETQMPDMFPVVLGHEGDPNPFS